MRPTPQEIEDIRANDCGHPECYECGARMKLLAEIDALRQECEHVYAAEKSVGGTYHRLAIEHTALAARVRELQAENEKMRKELAGFYAAESRRYIEPTFCKVCPHALAFHNADGSCPCGSNCAALSVTVAPEEGKP